MRNAAIGWDIMISSAMLRNGDVFNCLIGRAIHAIYGVYLIIDFRSVQGIYRGFYAVYP